MYLDPVSLSGMPVEERICLDLQQLNVQGLVGIHGDLPLLREDVKGYGNRGCMREGFGGQDSCDWFDWDIK